MNSAASLTPTVLGWIREDLDRLLDRLRLQVEHLASNPRAGASVQNGAVETSEELARIFDLLEIDGPRQVTESMHRLAGLIGDDGFDSAAEATAALLDAVVILPAYLDRLQAGHQDLPLLLLPLMNRLRSLAGREELTEGTVFTPLLDVDLPELEYVRKPGFDEPFAFFTGRLHRQFGKALRVWQQDPEQSELLSAMQGICETLRHRVQRYDLKRLWWVATEVIGGMMEDAVEVDVHLRRLLARLSLLIRNLADGDEISVSERVSNSVTQSLLYHVRNAEPGCEGIDIVRERFRLEELAPDSEAMMRARGTLSGQDRAMYESLSAAVEDELSIVKEALDRELREGKVDLEQRRSSAEALQRLGDTLRMLGLSRLGSALVSLIPRFAEAGGADQQEREASLMDLAEQLLLIEAALQEQIDTLGQPVDDASTSPLLQLSAHEMHHIYCDALDECVASMHAAEHAVREKLAGKVDADPFEALRQVAGALRLVGDTDAAAETLALEQCVKGMMHEARREETLDQQRVETVAEAMSALELYIAASRDHQGDAQRFLEAMAERVSSLEAPPETAETGATVDTIAPVETGEAAGEPEAEPVMEDTATVEPEAEEPLPEPAGRERPTETIPPWTPVMPAAAQAESPDYVTDDSPWAPIYETVSAEDTGEAALDSFWAARLQDVQAWPGEEDADANGDGALAMELYWSSRVRGDEAAAQTPDAEHAWTLETPSNERRNDSEEQAATTAIEAWSSPAQDPAPAPTEQSATVDFTDFDRDRPEAGDEGVDHAREAEEVLPGSEEEPTPWPGAKDDEADSGEATYAAEAERPGAEFRDDAPSAPLDRESGDSETAPVAPAGAPEPTESADLSAEPKIEVDIPIDASRPDAERQERAHEDLHAEAEGAGSEDSHPEQTPADLETLHSDSAEPEVDESSWAAPDERGAQAEAPPQTLEPDEEVADLYQDTGETEGHRAAPDPEFGRPDEHGKAADEDFASDDFGPPLASDVAGAEESAPAVPATAEPEPEEEADSLPPSVDPELREIFLEEYESVLDDLQRAIPDWMNDLENGEPLTEIRRSFHTLKGSGRMVGAEELGVFCWRIEDMLNALLEGRIDNFNDISVMVRLAQASLPALRQRMLQEHTGLTRSLIELLDDSAEAMARGATPDWLALRRRLPAYLSGMIPALKDDDEEAGGSEDDTALRNALAAGLAPLRELLDATARDRGARASAQDTRAAYAIAAALSEQPEGRDAEIAESLGDLLSAQATLQRAFPTNALFTLISAVGELQNRLDRLSGQGELSEPSVQDGLLDQMAQITAHFASESARADTEAGELDFEMPAEPAAPAAESAGTAPGMLKDTLDFDDLAAPEPTIETEPPMESLADSPDSDQAARDIPDLDEDSPGIAAAEYSEDQSEEPAAAAQEAEPEPPEPVTIVDPLPSELDTEILAIFLEEAREVLERADGALNEWRDDLQQLSWVRNLQREIHTFKGGARMAGLASLGEFSHEMESLLEQVAGGLLPPSLPAVQLLEHACDRLHGWIEQAAQNAVPDANAALETLRRQTEALQESPEALERMGLTPEVPSDIVPEEAEEPAAQAVAAEAAPIPEPVPTTEESAGSSHIRVDADLLDKMVNAAGEVSIYRSRIKEQVTNLRGNLGEFDKTIHRLREQFRKLEIEIEVQIRSNYADSAPEDDENFDPLELDQFTKLQELSRGLSESVSDLLNLQEMLEEAARNSENMLDRQTRVSTELQEGLMRTRMVPFGSIASRLRRIVRSSAKETGKQARLHLRVAGSSDELDRNVLEHITAPLEHMLRNAVAHGVESPEDRRAAGKNEQGEITIIVESEATEFVIRIADDGAGINLEAIRASAVERGLLQPQEEPSRQQLYDIMMNSGFSTSTEVTRLAGRGVGMDVVSSEIKQIGGSLEIDSEPGRGSRFTVRIPFTLAVMQAIGVVAGDLRYLLPLSSVRGVSRIEPDQYRELVEQENPRYHFAGEDCPVLDIESVLGERATPLSREPVSLLILSAGEQRAAVRVPELLPHREVVIKPLGPQISSVPGILGGAISDNGEVRVILDPGPLIRHALIHGVGAPITPAESVRKTRRLVMVVDDSITMRKVTTRVLEGYNFDVITAKDGVDALEQLQDIIPDVMLFDIEMPRMDGFELTERVREDARLRKVPVMMVTSRAGKKHRDRAAEAGADAFMSKPYREDDLIGRVFELMDQRHGEEGED